MNKADKEFYRGFGVAIGCIARDHNSPSLAVDVMYSNGVSFEDLRNAGVTEFDLKPILQEWYACHRYANRKRKIRAGVVANSDGLPEEGHER